MKSWSKRLLVGGLALAAMLIWPASRSWPRQPDMGKNIAANSKKVRQPTRQLAKSGAAWPLLHKSAWSPAETRTLIHVKLHHWLEVQANGGDDNDHSMTELESLLAGGDAADIIQSLSPNELNTSFGMDVLHQWMQTDLVSATQWIAANPEAMEDLTAVVAQGWAADPADLEDYLTQAPDSAWKQNFLLEAGAQLAVKNPEEAVKLAEQMTPGGGQVDFLQSVASAWMGSDPAAALAWIRSVNDPSLQEQLIASAAKSYALTDPEQAATWLAASGKSPEAANDAVLSILSTWAAKDPQGAANWASLFPSGEAKNAALDLVSSPGR